MKFTPGIAVGAMSGSVGGVTASRNRYGPYFRVRAKPVISTTPDAQQAKGIFTTQTTRWQTLTDAQRLAWEAYAETHLVNNSLGIPQALTGHQAFVGINSRIDRAGGTLLDDPPAATAPNGLESLVLSADIGIGTFDVTYTPTPLAADDQLWVLACVQNSAGKTYIENLLRLVQISSAAQASPLDIQAAVEAKFGTLIVGQKVSTKVGVYDGVTGLLSNFLRADAIVVST